jgi:hypothetical protein
MKTELCAVRLDWVFSLHLRAADKVQYQVKMLSIWAASGPLEGEVCEVFSQCAYAGPGKRLWMGAFRALSAIKLEMYEIGQRGSRLELLIHC